MVNRRGIEANRVDISFILSVQDNIPKFSFSIKTPRGFFNGKSGRLKSL